MKQHTLHTIGLHNIAAAALAVVLVAGCKNARDNTNTGTSNAPATDTSGGAVAPGAAGGGMADTSMRGGANAPSGAAPSPGAAPSANAPSGAAGAAGASGMSDSTHPKQGRRHRRDSTRGPSSGT